MVDIHVYGMHVRDDMIKNLKEKLYLADDCIHYDDRPNGGIMIYTAKKAWLAPVQDGITHRVALADDVDVCDDFWNIAEQIAATRSDDIISFFPYEFRDENPDLEVLDTPYVKTISLFGAAIMMPVKYIVPCFNYIKEHFDDNIADDDGIMSWAMNNGIKIITTIPATVQHIGDESIITPGMKIRRTVYYDKNASADWKSKKLMEYQRPEWFFSNHGKIRHNKGVLKYVEES